jgi:prophage regulatory protein
MTTPLLLSYADLKALGIGYTRTHLWRLATEGKFPKPVKLGPASRNCWSAVEVNEWIAQRIAEPRP